MNCSFFCDSPISQYFHMTPLCDISQMAPGLINNHSIHFRVVFISLLLFYRNFFSLLFLSFIHSSTVFVPSGKYHILAENIYKWMVNVKGR